MTSSNQLAQAIAVCSSNPDWGAKAMGSLLESQPQEFLRQSASFLERFELSRGAAYLLAMLGSSGHLLAQLSGLAAVNKTALRAVMRVVPRVYPAIEEELPRRFATCVVEAEISRCFDILDAAETSVTKALLLKKLGASANPKIRSRATLLLGRMMPSLEGIRGSLEDTDPRVRANAVEAIWAINDPSALDSLRWAATDSHGRTAANAWVGLYLRGELESLTGLQRMAEEGEPIRQASAAWAMGRTGDDRFLATLKRLVASPDSTVRSNALRAMSRIRQPRPDTPPATAATVLGCISDSIAFALPSGDAGSPESIAPLDVRVTIGGNPLMTYDLETHPGTSSRIVGFLVPGNGPWASDIADEVARTAVWRVNDLCAVIPYAYQRSRFVVPEDGAALADRPQNRTQVKPQFVRGAASTFAESMKQIATGPASGALLYEQVMNMVKSPLAIRPGPKNLVIVIPSGLSDDGVPESGDELLKLVDSLGLSVHLVRPKEALGFWPHLAEVSGGFDLEASDSMGAARSIAALLSAMERYYVVSFPPLELELDGKPATLMVCNRNLNASATFVFGAPSVDSTERPSP